ncbi:MAG: hypothetical protein RJA70_13 [Pseudomonadota bacterium]|jgi:chemotaxis protein MotB
MRKTKSIFGQRVKLASLLLLTSLASACGYSQEEWDHQLREIDNLQQQLRAQRQQNQKCDADYQASLNEIQDLKKRLLESGVNLDSLTQSLEERTRALKEFEQRAKQLDAIRARFELLRSKLEALTKLGLTVEVRDNRMLIALPGDVLFDSGKDKLTDEGTGILSQIAQIIRTDNDLNQREFQVAGHTDNIPLSRGPYKDNWGLSAMRARSVVDYLVNTEETGGKLDPRHWSAAGYGSTDPLVSNDTPEGRGKNRRVELVVMPNVEEMLNLNSLAAQ